MIGSPAPSRSVEDYEESVIFSEWRSWRRVSSRSLSRTRDLLRVLGYDSHEAAHRTLGIVGSKGKGTTAAYASAALAGLGHRVGTVMSPGVISNADRIRVDGRIIDETTRRHALQRIEQGRAQLPPPTEESGYLAPTGLFIVMAMLVFAEAGVDVVVAEAGIGGASDDLSHWPLEAVAVTGIFAEHLELLGPTVSDVARDKAAVITTDTQICVSCDQHPLPAAVLHQRCRATNTRLLSPDHWARGLVKHVPAGFQRDNAALGVSAGIGLAELTGEATLSGSHQRVSEALASVNYPGRLSVHPAPSGGFCVVDSAVSGPGMAAALEFADDRLGGVDQVLVCLPPDKDLAGFIGQLQTFPGRRIFVEMDQAYTGMPDPSAWPWEWVTQQALPELLDAADSLVVGTVLYTSWVLRWLGADAQQLFTQR